MEVEKVGFLIRFIAYIIDGIIISIPMLLINYLLIKPYLGMDMIARQSSRGQLVLQPTLNIAPDRLLLIMIIYIVMIAIWSIGYFVCFWSAGGQTPGKMVLGIRVISADGEIISFWRALLRYFGYIISGIIIYLGFLWITWDKDKQGWHDKIAGTYVVRTKRESEMQPY
jgi:uncharacterized RDD family membrane protein YckC